MREEVLWGRGCWNDREFFLVHVSFDRDSTPEQVVVKQTHHSHVFPPFVFRLFVVDNCTPNLWCTWAHVFDAADTGVAEDDVEEFLGVVHGLEPRCEHRREGFDDGAPDDHADVTEARVRGDAVKGVLCGGVLGPERPNEQLRQPLGNIELAFFGRSRDFEVVSFFSSDVFGSEYRSVVNKLLKVQLGFPKKFGKRLQQLCAVGHAFYNVCVTQFFRGCVSATGRSASLAAYTYIFSSRAVV